MDLASITIDENLIAANRAHLESAIGFVVFGERGIPRTLSQLNAFLQAEIPRMREFANTYIRQYHVPAVYTLATVAQQHVENALNDGEVPQLLMARNYGRAAFELWGSLLHDVEEQAEKVHQSFKPPKDDLEHFVATIFVLAATTNFLGGAVGAAITENAS